MRQRVKGLQNLEDIEGHSDDGSLKPISMQVDWL